MQKTYSRTDSLVVSHPTTGSHAFLYLWPYVMSNKVEQRIQTLRLLPLSKHTCAGYAPLFLPLQRWTIRRDHNKYIFSMEKEKKKKKKRGGKEGPFHFRSDEIPSLFAS